jgi:hypothetical protein
VKSASYCPNPVFIIGAPRSGSSVLAWSLAHHPGFWTSHETDFLTDILGGEDIYRAYQTGIAAGQKWFEEHDVAFGEFVSYVGLGMNALLASRSGGRRWVEQTPAYTLLADIIADAFPGAFFVHLVRDGRAVVRSMMHFRDGVWRASGGQGDPPEWSHDFEAALGTWCDFVRAAQDFALAHADRTFTVRNEDLVAEPRERFHRLLAFLETSDHAGPANFFRSSRINSSFGPDVWGSDRATALRPVGTGAAGMGWGFDGAQSELFAARAGALNRAFGYEAEISEATQVVAQESSDGT